jgi:hypothetical protein
MPARTLVVLASASSGLAGPPGPAGSGGTLMLDVTVSGVTAISYSVTNGAILVVRITQDSIGHAVTWSTDFSYAPTIDASPYLVSIVTFAGFSGKWVLCATPILGVI